MKSMQSVQESMGKRNRHSLQLREGSKEIKEPYKEISKEMSKEMSKEISKEVSKEMNGIDKDFMEDERNEEDCENEMKEDRVVEKNYYYDKNGYYYDSEGNYYDEDGNLVQEEYFYDQENKVYYDNNGNCFDENGNIITVEESSHSSVNKNNEPQRSFSKSVRCKSSDLEKKERIFPRAKSKRELSNEENINHVYQKINKENKEDKKSLFNYFMDYSNNHYNKKKKGQTGTADKYDSYALKNKYRSDYEHESSNNISPRSSYSTKHSYNMKKDDRRERKKKELEYANKKKEKKKKKKKTQKEIRVYEMNGYIPISSEQVGSSEWEEESEEIFESNHCKNRERKEESNSSKERNYSNKREHEKNVNFVLPNPIVTYTEPTNLIVCMSPNETIHPITSNQLLPNSCLPGIERVGNSIIPSRTPIQYMQANPQVSTNVLPHGYITKGSISNPTVQVRSYQTNTLQNNRNLAHNIIQSPTIIQTRTDQNNERCIINTVHAIPNTTVSIPFEKSKMQYVQPTTIMNRNMNTTMGTQNIVTSKSEFYHPTSIQNNRNTITSSSPSYSRLTQHTLPNEEYVSEITIFKNNERNLPASTRPIMVPNTNRIFVRNRSFTPNRIREQENQQRNKKVSPLKNVSLGRMYSQQSTMSNQPVCTHEVSYFSNETKSPLNETTYTKYPDTDSVITENSIIKEKTKKPNGKNKRRDITETTVQDEETEEEEEPKANKTKQKKGINQNSKTSESSFENNKAKRSWGVQTTGFPILNEIEVTEKMKSMNEKIQNLKKENGNLSDMTKLYKNECTRLRELLVKNNITNVSSSKIGNEEYEKVNLKLEQENEKLKNQMKCLGRALLNSEDINGIKQILAQQIVDLQEENEQYRNKIKILKKNNDVNHQVLFRLNKVDISADAMDSIFMQTKNIIIQGHESVNVLYLNLRNLIDQLFQKIRSVITKHEYTDEEKLSYLTNLEDIIKENFEELNEVVLKVNKLRKDMKDVRAKVFDINRGNAYCSCKPARMILEEDIKHLEEELHKHSVLLKNLRKTNLALHLQNLSATHGTSSIEESVQANKNHRKEFNEVGNINEHKESNDFYNHALSYESIETTNSDRRIAKDDDSCMKHSSNNKTNIMKNQRSSYLSHVYKPFNTNSVSEMKQNNLHDKIKVIEEQLNTLNHKMKKETNPSSSEGVAKDSTLVNKMLQKVIQQTKKEKQNKKEDNQKWKKLKKEDHSSNESSTNTSEEEEEEESSDSSMSTSTDTSSEEDKEDESTISYHGKNKNYSNKEIEKSKQKMIQLLSLLNKKGSNHTVIENIKHYVNAFGQQKCENQYNLQKVYDNLNIIKNQIKNTDDDTQKNILALIESQANEIKLFSNCVDELKNTIVAS